MGIDNIRNIKKSALLPKQKKIYRIPPVSKNKKARQRQGSKKKCDEGNSKQNAGDCKRQVYRTRVTLFFKAG